jgi:hypothetical protein
MNDNLNYNYGLLGVINTTVPSKAFNNGRVPKIDLNTLKNSNPTQFATFINGGLKTLENITKEDYPYQYKDIGMMIYEQLKEQLFLLRSYEAKWDDEEEYIETFNEDWINIPIIGGYRTVESDPNKPDENHPSELTPANVKQQGMTVTTPDGKLWFLLKYDVDTETEIWLEKPVNDGYRILSSEYSNIEQFIGNERQIGTTAYLKGKLYLFNENSEWEELPRKNDIPVIPEQNYLIVNYLDELSTDSKNIGKMAFVKFTLDMYGEKIVYNKIYICKSINNSVQWVEFTTGSGTSNITIETVLLSGKSYPAILNNGEPILIFKGNKDENEKYQIELTLEAPNSQTYKELIIKVSDEFILDEK